jgi:hypothetical protein
MLLSLQNVISDTDEASTMGVNQSTLSQEVTYLLPLIYVCQRIS